MSTQTQVLYQFYWYVQCYIKSKGGNIITSPPCGDGNFTFDVQIDPSNNNIPVSFVFHSWGYGTIPQPTISDLIVFTPEQVNALIPAGW